MSTAVFDVDAEIRRCKNHYAYAAETYFKIVHNSQLISFKRTIAQQALGKAMAEHQFVKVLKGRRLGSSTEIAAEFFHKVLFFPHVRVLVLAHSEESARNIFRIYKTFYDNLPSWMKVKTETGKGSKTRLDLVSGSCIVVATANSENARGMGYSYIHASETAFWDDLGVSAAAIFSTAWDNAQIVVETTANGRNQFYHFWKDDNEFFPLFLSWLYHEPYSDQRPLPLSLGDDEKEYLRDHPMRPDQQSWAIRYKRSKASNSIAIFKQEQPCTPDEAFLATGSPYFGFTFFPTEVKGIDTFGWSYFEPLTTNGIYLLGVDTASGGANGDYSAATVLSLPHNWDGTQLVKMAATYYCKIPPKAFAREMLLFAEKHLPIAVIESNSYGLSVIEDFIAASYPHMYHDRDYDKTVQVETHKVGFDTRRATRNAMLSRLYDYVWRKRLEITDPRLAYEMQHFVYNKTGKPEAQKGYHDDLVLSTGLALMGIDLAYGHIEDVRKFKKPGTAAAVAQWELDTGLVWSEEAHKYADDDDDAPDLTALSGFMGF